MTLEEEKDILLFIKAINNAEKMHGVLDYGVYFWMQVNGKDGSQRKYVLNIDKEFGAKGLLVESSNRSQGYVISPELSYELSKMIYQ